MSVLLETCADKSRAKQNCVTNGIMVGFDGWTVALNMPSLTRRNPQENLKANHAASGVRVIRVWSTNSKQYLKQYLSQSGSESC